MPSNTMPGYSMPVGGPGDVDRGRPGIGDTSGARSRSTASFIYSVERPQRPGPGFRPDRRTWRATVLPPGRLIRAASQTKAGEALNATSRRVVHVEMPGQRAACAAGVAGSPISSGERIITVVSLRARLREPRALRGVSTSSAF